MNVVSLSLSGFRNYETADLEFPADGLVVIRGENGQGKTNLLEAICYLATSKSFRETNTDSFVRNSVDTAIVRGTMNNEGRELLIESEITKIGRNRLNINRQPIRRGRTLEEIIAITTFSPDDLELVKASPSHRRNYIDDLLAGSDERARALQADLDRILRQRNALLRQSHGRLKPEIESTLDVWDERFATAAEQLGDDRAVLINELQPLVQESYEAISASNNVRVGMTIITEWRSQDGGKGMRETLHTSRQHDAARGTTTTGPYRDELRLTIDGLPSRSQVSQGEQRSLAIALRLAGHHHTTQARQSIPVLLLDDVFSELDRKRTEQLLASLPVGQCFLATAAPLPKTISPTQQISVSGGKIVPVA